MGTHKKCARAHDSRARDEVGGEKNKWVCYVSHVVRKTIEGS